MLRKLHIRNYVLIESLDIDFPEGLVIITGQTGAGKSILLGALSLLMGSKADASVISEGQDSCVVEAEFDAKGDAVVSLAEANDLDISGGTLLIRRVVSASGRSRSFVGDEPVTVGVLSELSSHLIDIHSQHSSLLLSDHSFQLSLLDHYAGNSLLLENTKALYQKLKAARGELKEITMRLETLSRQRSYDESRYEKLKAAALRDGEMEELEEEHKRLANAGEIKDYLQSAIASLDSSEGNNVAGQIKEASRSLSKAAAFVSEAGQLSERLESARIEIEDICSELESIDERTSADPSRLEAVEDRMSRLYDLFKMFGCDNVKGLIAVRDELGTGLYDSEALMERKESLEKQVAVAAEEYASNTMKLTQSRKNASKGFSDSIQSSVRSLELDSAVFEVEIAEATPGPAGTDAVTFLFSSTGKNPVDVAKCASGGEMSRIMLCLKAMMARYAEMPTLIFDEIDTGVSGSTADKMGSMICSMGRDMQVFAITHLPQVAAKGNAHYLVTKAQGSDGRTSSSIHRLESEERINEVARMLSGKGITPEAVANARVLLESKGI